MIASILTRKDASNDAERAAEENAIGGAVDLRENELTGPVLLPCGDSERDGSKQPETCDRNEMKEPTKTRR